ncbi:MAG: hypothetical protein LBR28_02175 [Bacteroidales bacterium]|jgi:hypothetical protein|nr:hypothetical protein [Bacteroidales bacterium]
MISKLKTSLLVLLVTAINSGVFAQNTNPYEKFGYVSKVEYKLPMEDFFRIINTDTTSEIKSMVIDFEKHIAYLLGEKDALITEFIIDPQEVLTWLSPDPKASKYPHQSPYVYCSNNPIMRVDIDGMADDWYEDANGNATWQNSKAQTYTDKNGNTYKNIGSEYLTFDGTNLTYYTQKEDKNGNLSI